MKTSIDLYSKLVIIDKYIYKIIPVIRERIDGGIYTIDSLNVPSYVIAILHFMESGGDMKRAIKNGRPIPASVSFKDNAIFSLKTFFEMQNRSFSFDSIEGIADFFERWNGLGYRMRGLYSPYLWAGTNVPTEGKYTSDGKYTSKAISKQIGAMAYVKALNISPSMVVMRVLT